MSYKNNNKLLKLRDKALEDSMPNNLPNTVFDYINELYKVGNTVYDTYNNYTVGDGFVGLEMESYQRFIERYHANKVYSLKLDDDYFCGVRANTFVVEYGYSERVRGEYYVITANHKGLRRTVVIKGESE